uniref:Coiled-coil domain containing 151 n=1 Tax=Salarias fasciatus TaxID=181472 RepID=A0A672I2K3_SALFA
MQCFWYLNEKRGCRASSRTWAVQTVHLYQWLPSFFPWSPPYGGRSTHGPPALAPRGQALHPAPPPAQPLRETGMGSSVQDKITEVKKVIQLLESEKKVEYEKNQAVTHQKNQMAFQLRQEIKRLSMDLADRSREERCRDRLAELKKLDALNHSTRKKQRHLEELQREYEMLKPHTGRACPDVQMTEQMATTVEAKDILQDESRTYQSQLDSLKEEIEKQRKELQRVCLIHDKANSTKTMAESDLQQLTKQLNRKRVERRQTVVATRRIIEECKAEADASDQMAREMMAEDEARRRAARITAEEEERANTRDIFRMLQQTTAATSEQDIRRQHVSCTSETHEQQERLKKENLQLKEEKDLLRQQLYSMICEREARRIRDQQTLEACEQQLQAQQQKSEQARENRDSLSQTLESIRPTILLLAKKLKHTSVDEDTDEQVDPDSVEFVLQQIKQCKAKFLALHTELQKQSDLKAVMKHMDEKFLVVVKERIPDDNNRIKLLDEGIPDVRDDEVGREEEAEGVVPEEAQKSDAQQETEDKPKKAQRTRRLFR